MPATRRFTLVLALAVATIALSAASVFAQAGAPNPSGGTSLRQTIEEGRGSVGATDMLSRDISIDLVLRNWLSVFAAQRYLVTAAARPVGGRTLTAVTQRKVWGR